VRSSAAATVAAAALDSSALDADAPLRREAAGELQRWLRAVVGDSPVDDDELMVGSVPFVVVMRVVLALAGGGGGDGGPLFGLFPGDTASPSVLLVDERARASLVARTLGLVARLTGQAPAIRPTDVLAGRKSTGVIRLLGVLAASVARMPREQVQEAVAAVNGTTAGTGTGGSSRSIHRALMVPPSSNRDASHGSAGATGRVDSSAGHPTR